MRHKQKYAIDVEVTGKSTMQLEMLEDWLISMTSVFNKAHSNIKIKLSDIYGNNLDEDTDTYSFATYTNGNTCTNIKSKKETEEKYGRNV